MTEVLVRQLGLQAYEPTWKKMQAYTESRQADSADEIWLLQHPPVLTLGLNGKPEHILNKGNIPVVEIDRGGQVTYHGPGQLVVYCLLDLKRRKLGVRQVVSALENSVIDYLASQGVVASARKDAPGVYVDGAKISALGLRVRRGCCYHGLSLNIDMDMSPFKQINPCGYEDLPVTQLKDLSVEQDINAVAKDLLPRLMQQLSIDSYTMVENVESLNTGVR